MLTKKFAIDANGEKAYEGTEVLYKNKVWLLEAIDYLSWNRNQYLTLLDPNNKIKKMRYIDPREVTIIGKKILY